MRQNDRQNDKSDKYQDRNKDRDEEEVSGELDELEFDDEAPTRLRREAKIGLSVIAILLAVFGVVLAMKLRDNKKDNSQVADAEGEDGASADSENGTDLEGDEDQDRSPKGTALAKLRNAKNKTTSSSDSTGDSKSTATNHANSDANKFKSRYDSGSQTPAANSDRSKPAASTASTGPGKSHPESKGPNQANSSATGSNRYAPGAGVTNGNSGSRPASTNDRTTPAKNPASSGASSQDDESEDETSDDKASDSDAFDVGDDEEDSFDPTAEDEEDEKPVTASKSRPSIGGSRNNSASSSSGNSRYGSDRKSAGGLRTGTNDRNAATKKSSAPAKNIVNDDDLDAESMDDESADAPSSSEPRRIRPGIGASLANSTSDEGDKVKDGPHQTQSYKVGPNENFWKVSEKFYGTGGYFRALHEFNRQQFPRMDDLGVGDVVQIPPRTNLEQRYPTLCPKTRNVPAPKAKEQLTSQGATGTRRGNTYIVAEGDTLFDIARTELGRAARWSEIYELNKDQLGEDFDYLSPGTELILPDDGGEDDEEDPLTRRENGDRR